MDIEDDIWERLSLENYESKIYLTNVNIVRPPNYGKQPDLGNVSLVIYGLNNGNRKRFGLKKTSQTMWTYMGCIELSSSDDLEIILNSDEIGDMGYTLFTRSYLNGLLLNPLGSRIYNSQRMFNVKSQPKPIFSTNFYILPSKKIATQPQEDWSVMFMHPGFQVALNECQDLGEALLKHSINLWKRFVCKGDVYDISRAVSSQEKAILLTPENDLNMLAKLNNLGVFLSNRFKHTGNLKDNANALAVHYKTVQLTPDGHSDMPSQLSNLGGSLTRRFEHTGNLADISEAISVHRKAVRLTSDSHFDMPSHLNNLGTSLTCRFEQTGEISDISEAISVHRKAVQLTPDGHDDMPSQLSNLGNSLTCRFECAGDLSDISEAISVHRKAIELIPDSHSDMPSQLNNLGNSLTCRFERTGELSDISEAISISQKAVQLTPDGHSNMHSRLNNLGNSLTRRFERTGDLENISEAISLRRKVVQLIPDGHSDMPFRLNNLGNSLTCYFERTGDLENISEAISVHRKAVQLTPDGHSDMPSHLNSLGGSLTSRFERTGDISDISEAISLRRRAIQLTPDGHSDMTSQLNNLGGSLTCCFEHTRDISDISEAIDLRRKAVQLTPDGHSNMPSRLNNLGGSLIRRFEHTENLLDISEAISFSRKAVQLTPRGSSEMPSQLNNLGASLTYRFNCTGDLSDITEAISICQKAVQLTPDGHSGMPALHRNLGIIFMSCFQRHHEPIDLADASNHFQLGATYSTGPPSVRLGCAQQWAQCCKQSNPLQSLEAFEVAIQLVSQVAGLEQTMDTRHRILQDMSELTLDASATAFSVGRPDKALEWLEQGRSLVWNQLNNLRTPLDALRNHDPALADRVLNVSRALENAGSRTGSNPATDSSMAKKITLEEEAHSHIKLANDWEGLLIEVCNIPGFEDFLQPLPCSTLLDQLPPSGLIVVINVHDERCDALVLIADLGEPLHIPLPDFSYKMAEELRDKLQKALTSLHLRMRGDEIEGEVNRGGHQVHNWKKSVPMQEILHALWQLVVKPILDGMGYSSPPTDSALLRIWWCATGPLAFLPLHAAGIYGSEADTESNISAFAVSSYTPTVTSLIRRFKTQLKYNAAYAGVLMAAVPDVPGLPRIPGTTTEVQSIERQLHESGIRSLRLDGKSATVDLAMESMASHSCIHFACHASQDTVEPLKSGFYFYDGKMELSAIVKKNLDKADFAFLSACQTSTGNEKLSEEAVHLAAGMLAAGYRSVIATMWSIQDQYGPVIAENVYKHLLERSARGGGKGINGSDSAYALHYAVQEIRKTIGDSEASLLAWVPYVHFGF